MSKNNKDFVMNLSRRDFMKNSAIMAGGISLVGCGSNSLGSGPQVTNMCGFTEKPKDKVRIGVIGLGMRGPSAVDRIAKIADAEIVALCDIREGRAKNAQNILKKNGRKPAQLFHTDANAWKKMCELDLDLVYVCTPWELHVPMAVYAMEHGKHAAVEVPVATTLEECWQIVDVSERTKKHCIILENCCYDFFELMTLNMAREGVFGELTHAEGAYIHNLAGMMQPKDVTKPAYYKNWRYDHNRSSTNPTGLKSGNPYATHGLGPVAQCMDVNRGNKIDFLTSMSSQEAAFTQSAIDKNREAFKDIKDYRGDMNTTLLKLNKGQTIMIQHDVSSPRPYSRIHLLQGSKGTACKWPSPARIALNSHHGGHRWLDKAAFKKIEEKYRHPLSSVMGSIARKVGGHGGMDFIMDYRMIYCLKNGLPLDMDVYDAAAWSAVTPLSYDSVKGNGASMKFPDFTRGSWKTNKPLDIVSVDPKKLPMFSKKLVQGAKQLNVQ